MLNESLKRVAVIGGAGKMGRGIALLLLQEMARLEAELTGGVGSGEYQLYLVDTDESGLNTLWAYLQPQLVKYAGQQINALRDFFAKRTDLIENRDIINTFVEGCLLILRRSRLLSCLEVGVKWVFEAVSEDVSLKKSIYQTIKPWLSSSAIYLTNTSSIPIGFLDQQSGLDHRLIGFHFYNPPPLQKLVELIPSDQTMPELIDLAHQLGKRLGKKIVVSADVAGFIGNGHFMRELVYACERVEALTPTYGREGAICLINRVVQQLLFRPMGIFQLVDYVGIEVCQKILTIMSCHIQENFQCPLIDERVSQGVYGGQDSAGRQRSGFFQYTDGEISAVFQVSTGHYLPEERLFSAPAETWASLVKDPHRVAKLKAHFMALSHDHSVAADEARNYLKCSWQIAHQLVKSGVAASIQDVSTVLETGFSHLYGVE